MPLLVVSQPAVAKEYVIGVADVVAISGLDNRDLDTVASVNPGGKIAVPSQEVQAAGLTAAEL
ncbi:MAG: polysaccharide biosynthesis/export family protein [Rhodopseudomonas palustris]|nr:polysaccharide biosynthesis/export family protein [Rhodopseudomonas palustris]